MQVLRPSPVQNKIERRSAGRSGCASHRLQLKAPTGRQAAPTVSGRQAVGRVRPSITRGPVVRAERGVRHGAAKAAPDMVRPGVRHGPAKAALDMVRPTRTRQDSREEVTSGEPISTNPPELVRHIHFVILTVAEWMGCAWVYLGSTFIDRVKGAKCAVMQVLRPSTSSKEKRTQVRGSALRVPPPSLRVAHWASGGGRVSSWQCPRT